MTRPQTCSHKIYTQTLTGVYQVVRYFLLAIFQASISIGTLESDSLFLNTPSKTKWTLIYDELTSSLSRGIQVL